MRGFMSQMRNAAAAAVRTGRTLPVVFRRNFSGGGGGGNSDSFYGRCMRDYPLATSALTASLLWGSGDIIAQSMDMRETPGSEFQSKRFAGVLTHGILIGGFGNYLWYNLLDSIVINTLRLTPGTLIFVAAKISLEIIIWHPTGLFVYWAIVGTSEGHSVAKIKRELKKDYVPTLLGDICLWTPCDVLNFRFIPVAYQTLFINCGSLVEAVALSYIHKHGTGGGDAAGAVAGAVTGAGEAGGKADEKIQEVKSTAAQKRMRIPMFDKVLRLEHAQTPEKIRKDIDLFFDKIDKNKDGFLTLEELKQGCNTETGGLLPGIDDEAVNAKVLELLYRLASTEGRADGKVSRAEYTRLLVRFCEAGYRTSSIADVVISIFDEDGSGVIEANEIKNVMRVYGLPCSPAEVEAFIKKCDMDKDGKISLYELQTFLKQQE